MYAKIKGSKCYKICFPFLIVQTIFKTIHSGEYEISNNETALGFCIKLLTHKKFTRKLTFPEGMGAYQIASKIRDCEYLTGTFEAIYDGDVFPDTYHYTRGTLRQTFVNNMKNKMQKVLSSIDNKTTLSMRDIVILASIIEKEAGNAQEMPIVSSVFHNRLEKKMRLQSCATVVYILTNYQYSIKRPLTIEETHIDSPYNTYRFDDLPPGPICCPGLNAIQAACNPAKTDFLYFVANDDNTGNIFATNWNDHLNNKKRQKKLRKHAAHQQTS